MSTCPQCHQPIARDALVCSSCGLELKAHGHPGIDLHRAEQGTYLCDSCSYHQDDSCTFPQRPKATSCTLYQNVTVAQTVPLSASEIYAIPWWRNYSGWLMLAALIFISIVLVLI